MTHFIAGETGRSRLHEELLARIDTVIDRSARVRGTFVSTADNGIRIDGRFKGRICLGPGSVILVQHGAVVEESELEADIILVAGYVRANVTARTYFEANARAEVHGHLACLGKMKTHPSTMLVASVALAPRD
ncbi:MAG: polymer-forming cytoskeletal protein [Hydrogenophaga sp.]|nr:polymer-forming cytoskeletal protein [Hydrogenophaga sp.]